MAKRKTQTQIPEADKIPTPTGEPLSVHDIAIAQRMSAIYLAWVGKPQSSLMFAVRAAE